MEQNRELMVEMETLPMLVTEVEEAIHRMQNTKISTDVSSVRVLQIRVRYNPIQTFRKLNNTKPHQREGKHIHLHATGRLMEQSGNGLASRMPGLKCSR